MSGVYKIVPGGRLPLTTPSIVSRLDVWVVHHNRYGPVRVPLVYCYVEGPLIGPKLLVDPEFTAPRSPASVLDARD